MITIISSLKKASFDTILIEILDQKSIEFYENLGFPKEVLSSISSNLKAKAEVQEKNMSFYMSLFWARKIIATFPKELTLLNDRCDVLRTLPKNSLYVPVSEVSSAYEALYLATYKYEEFLSKKEENIYGLYVSEDMEKIIKKQTPLLEAICRARDVINLPPTDTRPEEFVKYIQRFHWKNFTLRIIDAKELKKLGCNLLLAVWSGSDYPPYMVILERITNKNLDTYALIGKGVTFDAGWLQIKPDQGMLDMKCDMSGAAGMLGVAEYLDSVDDIACNVIIGLGITENVINGKAFKPLDIYRAYNGTTVEIHHTDAEWRLVLADVMSYVEDVYKPGHIITMATLTGACLFALWYDIAGIMGDDEDVINSLLTSPSPYESVWRLPLNDKMKKTLKAEIADLQNITKIEKAGSSIWWAFLTYFQGKAKLTHLDIAGPAYRSSVFGYMPKGATGWWVKILSEFILSLGKK